MDKFGRGSTQSLNLMSGSMQFNDNRNASQLLSQPFSQRSGLQTSRAFTQQQHSMISTSQTQHQGGFSHRSNCGTPKTQAQQPALSGVFRPGSAPQQPPASSQQLHMPAGSQWSQQQAASMELSQHANAAASSSLLRPKTVSLLRAAAGHHQLSSRPGSAPGLLSSGAAAGSTWQPSLLAPNQQRQQQQRQQQHHHQQQQPAPTFSQGVEGCQPQQQYSGGLQASQGMMMSYHGSQGLGFNDQLGSAGTETPSELLLGTQLPGGIAAVAAGKPSAKLQGLLQSLQDRRPKFGRPAPHQQQQPPAATLAAVATPSADTRAADPGPSPAATHADGADGEDAAAGNLAAAAAAAAAVAGSNLGTEEAAVVELAAAAHDPAVNAALEQRITSLQDCCSAMSAIVTRDIPSLLQHQLRADEQLQALAGSSTSCAALEAGLQGLAASVQGFMADFKAWQLQQEQQHAELLQLQQRSIADAASARAFVVLSTAACQTSPQLINGVSFMAATGQHEQDAPHQLQQLRGQGSCLQAIASPAGKRYSRQADPGCASTPAAAAADQPGRLQQDAERCCPQPFAAALHSTPAAAEPAEALTAAEEAAAANDQPAKDNPATCDRKQHSRQVQSKLPFPTRTTRSGTAHLSPTAAADASGGKEDGAAAAKQLPDGSAQPPVKPAGKPEQRQKSGSKGRKAAAGAKGVAAAAKGSEAKAKKAATAAGGAGSGGGGSGGQLTLQAAFRSAAHSSQPGVVAAAAAGAAAAAVEVDALPLQAPAAAAAGSEVQGYFQRRGSSSLSAARTEPEVRADVAAPITAVDDGPAAAKLAAQLPPMHHRTQPPAAGGGSSAARRSAAGSQAAGGQRPAASEGHAAARAAARAPARAPASRQPLSAGAAVSGGGGGRFGLMKRDRSGQLLGERAVGAGGGGSFAAAAAAASGGGGSRPAVSSGTVAGTGSRWHTSGSGGGSAAASGRMLLQRPASAPRTAGAASFRSASPASLLFSEALDSDSLDEVRQQAAGDLSPPEVNAAAGDSMEVAGGRQQEPDVAASVMLVDEEEIARQVAAHLARHRNKRRRAMQTASGQQQAGRRSHV